MPLIEDEEGSLKRLSCLEQDYCLKLHLGKVIAKFQGESNSKNTPQRMHLIDSSQKIRNTQEDEVYTSKPWVIDYHLQEVLQINISCGSQYV